MSKYEGFEEQMKELAKIERQVKKQYGKGTIVNANNKGALNLPRISTGSFSLDVEIGGGFPENRIVVLTGREGTAKTTMGLKAMANALEKHPGQMAMFVEVENGAWEPNWAKQLGVDLDRVKLVRPQYAEQAMDIVEGAIRTGAICYILMDSITALLPGAEFEGAMEDDNVGLNARINSKFMRKISSAIRGMRQETEGKCSVTLVLITQVRMNIMPSYETLPGGRALKHYPSIIIKFKNGEEKTINIPGRGKIKVGKEIKFVVYKNKTFVPEREGSFDFYFDNTETFRKGEIDRLKEIVFYGVLWDVLIRRGGYYYINEGEEDEITLHGKENLLIFLRKNKEILGGIAKKVLSTAIKSEEEHSTLDKGNLNKE